MGNGAWRAVFRHRSGILLLLAAPVAVLALRGGGVGGAAGVVGFGLLVSGVALRLLAMRQIGRGARVQRAGVRSGLCVAGPYRWSRNPLYLAAALMVCGLGVLAGAGWGAGGLLLAALAAYTPIARHEEKALAAELGEPYRDYAGRTACWVGRPGPRSGAPAAPTSWREVFRRERKLLPGALAAGVAVVGVRGEWVPAAPLLRKLGWAGSAGMTLACGVFLLALVGNAIAVERHRFRRAEARRR